MYEKRLKELSRKIGERELKTFYIFTHKKHQREVYFQNNKKAKEFLKNKLNSNSKRLKRVKKISYYLIKIGLLQPFLKKVKLSDRFGDVVFLGEQVKGFNLSRKEVISFPKYSPQKDNFVHSKKTQEEQSKKGLAPKILELNKKIPYSKEELLKGYKRNREIEIFNKIMSFYENKGIKKNSSKKYIKNLKNKIKEDGIGDGYLKRILNNISNVGTKILLTTIHGDFARENILLDKNNEILFIDWNPRRGLIIEDLVNFFRTEEDLLGNKRFNLILKEVFPKEVTKNIRIYLILNEISRVIKLRELKSLSKKRLENLLF